MRVLDTIAESRVAVSDLVSGEEAECAVCLEGTKPCEKHPGYRCSAARKQDTELQELEHAMRRIDRNASVECTECGRKISRRTLNAHPTRGVCDRCAARLPS